MHLPSRRLKRLKRQIEGNKLVTQSCARLYFGIMKKMNEAYSEMFDGKE